MVTVSLSFGDTGPGRDRAWWEPFDVALDGVPRIGDQVKVARVDGYPDAVYVTVETVVWVEGGGIEVAGTVDAFASGAPLEAAAVG